MNGRLALGELAAAVGEDVAADEEPRELSPEAGIFCNYFLNCSVIVML